MALQLKTFVSGRINNVVFYERGGTYIARSQADEVKLSAATKVCNGNFGMASACVPAFVPTQSIAAPAHTVLIECTITTGGSLLMDDAPTGNHTVTITIPYNNIPVDEQVITLPVPCPAGTLLVTAVALRYQLVDGSYCNKPAFLPASVIDARYC